MKKNVMMRVASIMLVLVLMSSSVISGTFAKYVTQGKATDSARVAKWGVEFKSDVDGMFLKEYNYEPTPNGVTGQFSVESTEKVVAPGTKGEGYSFTTVHKDGTAPEVSYEVSFVLDDTSENIFLGTYLPIEYKVTVGTTVIGSASHNFNDLKDNLAKARYMYDVDEKQYYISDDAGATWTPVGGPGDAAPEMVLSWEWPFEQGFDAEDTVLGYLVTGGYTLDQAKALAGFTGAIADYNLRIVLNVTATATQID